MANKKKNQSVVAICIQEPVEDGTQMDLGAIKGDDLRFLHQAFITDTVRNALKIAAADIRLYFIDESERRRLVKIVTEYLAEKSARGKTESLKDRFTLHPMERERWGIRIEKVFRQCFDDGYQNVIVVGSRTPTYTAKMMQATLRMLEKSDVVFGPTPEGRYYTIGMSGACHINLSDFDWRSPKIYSEVANAFTEKGLSWSELEIWYAIESSDDLELMARDINQYRFEGDETTARETELVMERFISKLGS